MVYSKWRKIAVILFIIILIISIFTNVFGAFQFEYNGSVYNVGEGISSKPYYFLYVCKPTSTDNNWTYYYLVSDKEFTYSPNGGFQGYQAFHFNTSSHYDYERTSSPTSQPNPLLNIFNISTINMTLTTSGFLTQYLNIDKTNGFVYTNFDLKYYNSNNIFNENNDITYPFFSPSDSVIQALQWSNIYVEPADFGTDDPLYLHNLEIGQTIQHDNNTIYYYSDNIISLSNDSSFYTQYLDTDYYYYSIPKHKFNFGVDKSYLLVLSSSPELITNSIGLVDTSYNDSIFQVVQINTSNIITSQDVSNDKIQNIDDSLNDNIVTSDTETNIDNSLNFDNKNEGLNNLNNGFFSRLTLMLSNLLGYNLADDTSVSLPLPNSNKSITLHSKDIYDNVTGALRLIINAFWVYIFSFYMWKFINKIYIAVSTGNILDTFSSSGEAITNDML